MRFSVALMKKINVLAPDLKDVFWDVLEEMEKYREEAVTKTEFNHLDKVVGELAEAQKRTEQRVKELTEAQKRTEARLEELAEAQKRTEVKVEQLAEAQKRTEARVEELTEAQKRTEVKVEQLAEAQKRTEARLEELAEAQRRTEQRVETLSKIMEEMAKTQHEMQKESMRQAQGLENIRSQVGGLSRSVAYALENEAYRNLPGFLKTHHQIEIEKRFVRKFIGDEEINIFAKAERSGEKLLIVGESVLRLDDGSKLGQLEKKVNVVQNIFDCKIFPLIITHMARPDILEKAVNSGVLVVQSFEWE